MSNRLIKTAKRLGLLALAGTYAYCELAEPPGIRVDQAAKPLLSPAERAALRPDTRAGLEAYEAGDYSTAQALWRPHAEAGDAEAMFGTGRIYGNGRGVTRDRATARRWFKLSAKTNHSWGLFNYAYYLDKGYGGSQDKNLAITFYELSFAVGNFDASYNLRHMYRKGLGVPQDDGKAYS